MKKLHTLIHSLLLVTTPALFAHPYDMQEPTVSIQEETISPTLSYDRVLKLLEQIESGEIEKNSTPEELEKIQHFIAHLAKEGALPDNSEESLSLDDDIQELLYGEDESFEYIFALGSSGAYMVAPAVFYGGTDVVLCKGWVAKRWKHVKKFVKKHKKAILIGAAVVVGAAIIVAAVVAAAPAAAAAGAGAAGAAGAAAAGSDKKDEKASDPMPSEMQAQAPHLQGALNEQISNFKENLVSEQYFQSNSSPGISWEENARILGSLFAHQSYVHLEQQLYNNPIFCQEVQNLGAQYSIPSPIANDGHSGIDSQFSTDYGHLYANPSGADFNTLSYQLRGERALAFGYYDQAIQDLGKVIEANPTNPIPYIERGVAHFGAGQYDQSLEDYKQFTSQVQPLSIPEFSLGFAKGLPQGIYESGRGLLKFVADVTMHPIRTGEQMYEAFVLLSDLARAGEWETLREVLVPEVHQLVNEWDTIPSDTRGELIGYAFGKYGTDILGPAAFLKVVSKGAKGAQELIGVYRGLKTAEQTFLLESAAGLGDSATIAEVVQLEKGISEWLGEGTRFIRNEAGDPVFLSQDGLRCVRFDFNKTKPHNNPHVHVEIKVDGKWVKSGPIYPTDVPHN